MKLPSYSQDVIEQVREGNDILSVVSQYVSLRKRGSDHFGLCPFHREKSPSFSVSESKQIFYCFGCGAGGNVITFIMRIENYGFVDAIQNLADRIHYTLPSAGTYLGNKEFYELRESLYEINKKTARFFYEQLSTEEGKLAVSYLDNRQISISARRKYGLGYSPKSKNALFKYLSNEGYDIDILIKSGLISEDRNGYCDRFYNRLMFPIFDLQNRITGFGGRILDNGKLKYINSPDTAVFNKSRNIYSVNFLRKEKTEKAILVEGYMDVISLYQAGFKNAVAALGTSFNAEHAQLLKKVCKSVVLLFDSDEAGQKAVFRAIEVLRNSNLEISVLQLEGAKDPDEYLKKYGKERFQYALQNALPYVNFQINCAKKKYNLNNVEEKIKFTKSVSIILTKLENAIERDAYIKEAANISGIEAESIEKEISKQVEKIELLFNEKVNSLSSKHTGGNTAKGIDEAYCNVLYVLAVSNVYSESIKKYLRREEFVTDIYLKLFDTIVEERNKKGAINEADLISFFENPDEQQIVSNIFSATWHYDDEKKALSDHIRKIKENYLKENLNRAYDNELDSEIQLIAKELRSIKTLVIEL